MRPLTPKQNAFCAEYLKDMNATKAAIRAGYSAKSAEAIGAQLLKKTRVARIIDSALGRRALRVEVTTDDVLRELIAMAQTDISQAFDENGTLRPFADMPHDVRRMISAVETEELKGMVIGADGEMDIGTVGKVRKVKFWSKEKALELLGRHLKMYVDKVEHSADSSLEALILAATQKTEPEK